MIYTNLRKNEKGSRIVYLVLWFLVGPVCNRHLDSVKPCPFDRFGPVETGTPT